MAPPKVRFTARVSINALSFAELCLKLTEGEYSKTELMNLIGIKQDTVRTWLGYLKDRELVYICEWRRTHNVGALTAIWTWGHKIQDVKKPGRKSQAEYTKIHQRNKLLGALYDIARTET